ncbi:protein MHF2 homolog isoform X1 [Coffea eugenioides]|uniref:Protein MHF2 homolog isoform X1 n=1 Tax=Coffea arabica TaxID=13443 RepID=A0A6P6XD98_COFAR|nr:protein MHF2 homolog isoform X1 [Coffea arabica]XP_027153622.1 protein MHF2 homolog isoform X1 [Coffea eugenioides]
METSFDSDLIGEIFKRIWRRRAAERERNEVTEAPDTEVGVGTPKKSRPTLANAKALKLSSELLRLFVTEAVQRAAMIAEAEGASTIEATHLERILPQLLLDF